MEFTKEMADRLYRALTQGGVDCGFRGRWRNQRTQYCYEIKWVFRKPDDKNVERYWQFIVTIPANNPVCFEVRGCSRNPKYTNDGEMRRKYKEWVRKRASEELYRIVSRSQEWEEEQRGLYDEYAELHGG
jgi:hypothetical protein